MKRLAAGIVCLLALPAYADEPLQEPAHWLERMVEAARAVSFHGEIVHMHGKRVRSMELARYVDTDGTVERLLVLDGPPREAIRDGKQVRCIVPGGIEQLDGERIPRNPFPGKDWKHDDSITGYYDFHDLDTDRVAGRECRVIGIQPRDGYRYGYRLWIDQETGLLLKSNLVDESGEVIEKVAFTRISIPDNADSGMVQPTLTGENLEWRVGREAPPARTVSIRVESLPDGYVARSEPKQRGRRVVQQVFTDGLASVSVFVEPHRAGRSTLEGTSSMGAVNAYGAVLDGWQVTVVGEVPAATVERIGESVRIEP